METKIQARIDSGLKAEGEAILKKLGMTTTELMRMTFSQLVMRKGLPFEAKIPNDETIAAFNEDLSDQVPMTLEEFTQKYSRIADEVRK